jgi:ATP-dependent protease Clp ATPase subunit
MYDLPSQKGIDRVVVDARMVEEKTKHKPADADN